MASAAEAAPPAVGSTVKIHSLVGRADLNGTHGLVVSFDEAKGRCGVKIETEPSPIALKPANLETVASIAPDVSDAPPVEVNKPPAASAEDALIEAVQQIWLGEPGLSAKAVHAKMSAEAQWASVSFSDVKKACSKATKRSGGAAAAAAPKALPPADPLNDAGTKRLGKLGAMDVCSEFAGALWLKLTGDKARVKKDGNLTGGSPIPQSPDGLFAKLVEKRPAEGKRSVVYLSLGQVEHSMILELANERASGELKARPFAAWVYAPGGDELNEGSKALARDARRLQRKMGARGFRAEEWAADGRWCRWWSQVELQAWCGRLGELRARVEALVASDLQACAPAGLDLSGCRMWAKEINDRCEVDGLMMQPANMLDEEMVKDYTRMLRRAGIAKQHIVIHRLIGNQMANAEQLLDFPLSAGAPIADLVCELFGEHPSAGTFMRMIEFAGHAEAWEYAVAEAKGVPGT